jgi:hypothetical protein
MNRLKSMCIIHKCYADQDYAHDFSQKCVLQECYYLQKIYLGGTPFIFQFILY